MKLVIFGLTISSSWGNGHATLWRALCRALHRRGHEVVFFERDVSYYAAHRDLWELEGTTLVFYDDWTQIETAARRHLADADVGMVTSYCPDGVAASRVVLDATRGITTFYDLDTPVTLNQLKQGERVPYLPAEGLGGFDLVLSYTGGEALRELQKRLGARAVAPLYGHVDPEVHRPVPPQQNYICDFSYLGTYAADRQSALVELFVEPARRLKHRKFIIGGAQYPSDFPWAENIFFCRHLPPSEHPAFFSSSRATLNVTRKAMAEMGWCPSGRLFEAAACGVPLVTDTWPGLEDFFTPGQEILVAGNTEEAIAAIDRSPKELREIAEAARARVLSEHTSDHRVLDLENALTGIARLQPGELESTAPALA
jgi:spore maturation protein CgeB